MTTGASARDHLHRRLEELLGAADAAYLMERLPAGPDDLATRRDLAVLRAQLEGDISQLRTDFAELRSTLSGAGAEAITRTELAENLRRHIDASVGSASRRWFVANSVMQAATIGAVVAAIRL